jgi:hypothetical protein
MLFKTRSNDVSCHVYALATNRSKKNILCWLHEAEQVCDVPRCFAKCVGEPKHKSARDTLLHWEDGSIHSHPPANAHVYVVHTMPVCVYGCM